MKFSHKSKGEEIFTLVFVYLFEIYIREREKKRLIFFEVEEKKNKN